jgi:putative endonuclease
VNLNLMSQPTDKTAKQAALDKGTLAEELVAQWLIQQGWEILERRWRCQMGELDLIAYHRPIASSSPQGATPKPAANLAFVEVKARSSGNWDADGMLAVNAQKQTKLWRSAQLFLATHPNFANLPCSFDVALVHCRRSPKAIAPPLPTPIEMGKSKAIAGYFLTLSQYIPAAFDR